MGAVLNIYRQPLIGRLDRTLRNCLYGAGALGALALAIAFLAPLPATHEVSLEEIPERYAKLILEQPAAPKPKNQPVAAEVQERPRVTEAPATPVATVEPAPRPTPRRRAAEKPQVAPDRGVKGRERAETEVKAELAAVTGSLDKALDQLATALPAAGESDEADAARQPRRRRRGTRGGRASGQLASATGMTNLQGADLGGTALTGQAVAIAGISDLSSGADAAEGGESGSTGGTPGRSSESLLAVVRRYAPGIQFCYENELKKDAGLRGKLVVGLTVRPDGTVSGVVVVENTLGSLDVVDCAVAQMHGWRFPAIEGGVSTFKAPFVFTPPDS